MRLKMSKSDNILNASVPSSPGHLITIFAFPVQHGTNGYQGHRNVSPVPLFGGYFVNLSNVMLASKNWCVAPAKNWSKSGHILLQAMTTSDARTLNPQA